jgi:pimeloyl-ACP methyl ester carboxylesterase
MTNSTETKTFILIHGAWGAAWVFDEVNKLLSKDGSKVYVFDLPGHGENQKEISDVTMDAYVNHIDNFISKIDGKVILVGHSLGGAIMSQVAERISNKIEKLIYVAAMLPKNGDSPLGLIKSDKYGQLLPCLILMRHLPMKITMKTRLISRT